MAAIVLSVVPVFTVVLLAVLALLFTKAPRPVALMVPAFAGAILSGPTLGIAFSTFALLDVIQGVMVTGAGGLAVVSSGIYTANQVIRICLYASALAALLLVPRFLWSVRRSGDAGPASVKQRGVTFVLSILPFFLAAGAFASSYRLADVLISPPGQMPPAGGATLARFVSSRGLLIASAGLIGFATCLLGVFAPLFFGNASTTDRVATRFGTFYLPVLGASLVAAIVTVERFFALVWSYRYLA